MHNFIYFRLNLICDGMLYHNNVNFNKTGVNRKKTCLFNYFGIKTVFLNGVQTIYQGFFFFVLTGFGHN